MTIAFVLSLAAHAGAKGGSIHPRGVSQTGGEPVDYPGFRNTQSQITAFVFAEETTKVADMPAHLRRRR
jgi:hypothetical protein